MTTDDQDRGEITNIASRFFSNTFMYRRYHL